MQLFSCVLQRLKVVAASHVRFTLHPFINAERQVGKAASTFGMTGQRDRLQTSLKVKQAHTLPTVPLSQF